MPGEMWLRFSFRARFMLGRKRRYFAPLQWRLQRRREWAKRL